MFICNTDNHSYQLKLSDSINFSQLKLEYYYYYDSTGYLSLSAYEILYQLAGL